MASQVDHRYIERLFRAYYSGEVAEKIFHSAPEPEKREWAFLRLDGPMVRHVKLTSIDDLHSQLDPPPKGIYYSLSTYEYPDYPMPDKQRIKTDVAFDLDADHIRGAVLQEVSRCKSCGWIGEGDVCRECGGEVRKIQLVDDRTIKSISGEVSRLLDRLANYLDVDIDRLRIFFSGLRGYHIHLEEEPYRSLDSVERIELKDFLTLDGVEIHHAKEPDSAIIRILEECRDVLSEVEDVSVRQVLESLVNSKDNPRHFTSIRKRLGEDRVLRERVSRTVRELCGVNIDPVVVTDMSRLIRAPYSLHGKSSLIKTPLDMEALEALDPPVIALASPSNNMVKVHVDYVPHLIWGGREIPSIHDEDVILPEPLAIYLVNMGLAQGLRHV